MMCADRGDHGVPEVLAAADGCACSGRWCEREARLPFPTVNDVVAYQNTQSQLSRMAVAWHDVSDHANDGAPFGGLLCNCISIASRALDLGWADR